MTFRVDGVSASYPQWQRSCCCDGRSVGKLGPGRVCGVQDCDYTQRKNAGPKKRRDFTLPGGFYDSTGQTKDTAGEHLGRQIDSAHQVD